jgi:putative membrane protein
MPYQQQRPVSFLARLIISAISLAVAAYVVPGFEVHSLASLIVSALLLGVANAILRPILIILTLPVTLLSLGLFLLVINAAMIGLVAWIVPGFTIHGFGPALLGWLIVSVVGWVATKALV